MDTVTIDGDEWEVVEKTPGSVIIAVRKGMTAITSPALVRRDEWIAVAGDWAKDDVIEALELAKDAEDTVLA